jgi:methionyl-tRNA formyltransferase
VAAALRIIFCGTPAFAVPTLRHLKAQPDFRIEGIVTQPDRPRGRGQETSISPVKAEAIEAGIPVHQPEKVRAEESREYFKKAMPDVVVIIAYGQIIPARLIEIPRLGWINLHGSLLPKYRGAAPINWAIVNGDTKTGLTTMQIDPGVDTGPMLLKYETEIHADETAPELTARLSQAGGPLMAETLRKLSTGEIAATPQENSDVTFAPLLKKEDGNIHWSLPAHAIYNRIRGLQPWPGAFTSFRGKNCQIWGKPLPAISAANDPGMIITSGNDLIVACGQGTGLRLDGVQLEGRKRVTSSEFANGARLAQGERLGS